MSVTLLHSADLHLSESSADHGFAVLDDLLARCAELRPHLLLLCGDVFDTHRDAEALAGRFGEHLRAVEHTRVVMIPGNHELLPGRALADLRPQALGQARLLLDEPVSHLPLDEVDAEIVAVPFRRDLTGYLDWPRPPRSRAVRIGMFHGVVNGMTYTGESAEADHAVIDPDLFRWLELDYAALGHIHARGRHDFGGCPAHYPGSARVWRRGEEGPRCASLVVLEGAGVRIEEVPLAAAGQYRAVAWPVAEDGALLSGQPPAEVVAALAATAAAADWVEVRLTGFVERRELLAPLRRELERAGRARFRRLEVDDGSVVEAEALRGHPLVTAFQARWREALARAEAAGDAREVALLERARQQALEQIQARLAGG